MANEENQNMDAKKARARVLVVEDEPFISMLLSDMLEELGFDIAAAFAHVAETQDYLVHANIDIALLDVNLGGEKIDPIADLLAARGCPFIFTTGYGRTGVPENFADRPVLQKPFQLAELASALDGLLAFSGTASRT